MPPKKPHMTLELRTMIEDGLNQRLSLKEIAAITGKSKATISREVQKRRTAWQKGGTHRIKNRCKSRMVCIKKYCCPVAECNFPRREKCSTCNLCNQHCSEFEEEICASLSHPPYVCNGCKRLLSCVLNKKQYRAREAHSHYRKILCESRTGINITEQEIRKMDEILSPLIKQGHSIHHVLTSFPSAFIRCEKTIYTYMRNRLFEAKIFHCPQIKRRRLRPTERTCYKVDKKCRINRTLSDFHLWIEDHPGVIAAQMDSVIGTIGGKVLLTLYLPSCHFLFMFLRDWNSAGSVEDIFTYLDCTLGRTLFQKLFPVILTDNGSEFSNPTALEFDSCGVERCRIFYCDAQASNQKAEIESAHRFIRRVLPKGTSFDSLSQDRVSLLSSHINSYNRVSLNNQSPFDLFKLLYGQNALTQLGLCRIPSDKILLSPVLLGD